MVLDNILDNASKYSANGSNVHIGLDEGNRRLRVSIKDEGVGIARRDMPKLFKKFSRIDNPLSIPVGGTGLGLYWAQKIVKLHGGSITVSSKVGQGSDFKIHLPSKS